MKIAFVTQPGHAVIPASGSVELWADTVARRLAARHDVTIFASEALRARPAPPQSGASPTFHLVPHRRGQLLVRAVRRVWRAVPTGTPFFSSLLHPIEYWIRVAWVVRRRRIEIVHVFNYSQALPILARLTRAKLVLHMHCEWLTQLDGRMIERRLRHADLVIGCSDYITDKVRERFPRHAERCTTIYNGIDAGGEPVARRSADGAIRLLNVGRVSPEKGLHVLVDALDRLVEAHPEVRLTVLGEESPVPYEFAVEISEDALVRDLGRFYAGSYLDHLRGRMTPAVAERVTFVDRVPHDRTRRFYEEADVFVFPSIFEAFPIPPIEAMAAGLPVIASKAGGVVESVVHEETGLLVERDDADGLAAALLRLVRDERLRRSFGEAGRARVRALYAWERIVDDVESAFSALVERSAASLTRSDEVLGVD